MPLSKDQWRAELQQQLEQLGSAQTLQQKIFRTLVDFMKSKQGLWGIYQAKGKEVSLLELTRECAHCEWAFPRVIPGRKGREGEMEFWKPGTEGFARGPFGILEPVEEGAQKCAPSQFQGFIIPGLGFDYQGHRLGWGKGFYDRYLSQTRACKVGVSYHIQRVPLLPAESWDVAMDIVITDEGVFGSWKK